MLELLWQFLFPYEKNDTHSGEQSYVMANVGRDTI